MGRFIVKLAAPDEAEYYLEWSTIVDAPVTCGMALNEFREHYRTEYGERDYPDLEYRLDRVAQHGTSARDGWTPEQLIAGNRAGPQETTLTMDEIITAYCLQLPIRDGWSAFDF